MKIKTSNYSNDNGAEEKQTKILLKAYKVLDKWLVKNNHNKESIKIITRAQKALYSAIFRFVVNDKFTAEKMALKSQMKKS